MRLTYCLFVYCIYYQRIKQVAVGGQNSGVQPGTTWYLNGEDSLGLTYEKELKGTGITEHKHYLQAGGITFAMHTMHVKTAGGTIAVPALPAGTNPYSSVYLHHDQLGSIIAMTNTSGVVVERLAYDPWGKRRFINGTADTLDAITSANIDRGFTMHEHIDEMGIINMNGRIYDPLIGRFMSADPIIQAPYNLKSFNRYSYVWNNPLKFFDPAGFEVHQKNPDGTNTTTISNGDGTASDSYTGNSDVPCGASCGSGTKGQGVRTGSNTSGSNSYCTSSCYDVDGNLINPPKPPANTPNAPGSAATQKAPPAQAPSTSITLKAIANTSFNGLTIASKEVASFITWGYSDKATDAFNRGEIGLGLAYLAGVAVTTAITGITDGGAAAVMKVAQVTEGAAVKVVAGEVNIAGKFFEGTTLNPRVIKQQQKLVDNHTFPASVDGFAAKDGVLKVVPDSRGKPVQMLTVEGAYKGREGTFEYIKNESNQIYHRYFNGK
jgi:RHS repeat-associated protein